ncbi:hypothetical protein [Pseudomonas sp. KU43P]|uniref:hypothetical protein n=1 Tax=Pseudomonas sp. KU43P TaxID=2487887 RepID=UPI0012AA97FB|nr:hypothetical protein [Pseudomonas sp. KU43P]BBH45561.1 hypothetical protein KU43P_20380 [Pseudomonas sp. KU43P]
MRRIAKPARQREGGDVLAGVHQQPPGLVQAQYQNALIERDDFLLNPHIAWSSEDAMQQLMDSAVDNISAFVARQIRGNDSRRA